MLSNYHHLIDALPYYDKGYDEPGVREASQALVEEETKTFKPTKNYLQHLSLLDDQAFETEIMRLLFTSWVICFTHFGTCQLWLVYISRKTSYFFLQKYFKTFFYF